jgi:tetratricopeptide (TPR) repeat protein
MTRFDLIVTADSSNLKAEFRLLDAHGSPLAYRQTDFGRILSRQRALFDLHDYLRLYVEEGREAAAVAEIGVCVAEEVLGQEIFEKLWKSNSQRTLRIELPGASDEENHLAAALARVPWEIARPSPEQPTLNERNLLVRIVHDMAAPPSQPIELAPNEALRVLFVLAEARDSPPLGARQERRQLLQLFEREIYPHRRVVAHFLTHGVTRERLQAQIRENGGYHAVHWSGHGHLDLLELAKPGGAKDYLSGSELLDLFSSAGGFLPRLVFLGACHSGDILRVKDWSDFLAVAKGNEPPNRECGTRGLDLAERPGYTGTAHALLQGGVPAVVAMRYDVSDDYARELAVEFYRALLAHAQPKNVAGALTLARLAMLDIGRHDTTRFAASDHATPVLYGAEEAGFTHAEGRSPSLNPRNPCLHQIAELTLASHEHFVGRTWELAGLGSDFIGSSSGAEVKPVAVITGLGGMGKTALVAEALALWATRFDWVFLYQAKPNALGFEATLHDIHLKLIGELGVYHDHVRAKPADAIYRDGTVDFAGTERLERLTRNLLRALKDEAILLVLDNFESNLKPRPEPVAVSGQPVWACQDPAWDHCIAALANELIGSRSRVLITSRRPLAVANGPSHQVGLGPLPAGEAALFLTEHPGLSRMVFGADADERALALRLLDASRFHPLLMDRLARLASHASLRPQLLQALDTLETTKEFDQLPELFATSPGDSHELAYLEDALALSLDQLIRGANPDARRLLWMIALANEPVTLKLLKAVWSGEDSPQEAQLRHLKRMFETLPEQTAEVQADLEALPHEVRVRFEALRPEPPSPPEMDPLLRYLVSTGLATEGRSGLGDENRDLTCHELVRERICVWIERQPQDRGELTENTIRLAYADRLEMAFHEFKREYPAITLRAGIQCLVYFVQTGAWDRVADFAGYVVTRTHDPGLLGALIPHLQTAAESAPRGRVRELCRVALADAHRWSGNPDASLPLYEQSASVARAIAESDSEGSQAAWAGLGTITGRWADALLATEDPGGAKQRWLESAEAYKSANSPEVAIIAAELGALRIDILNGNTDTALPKVEARLAKLEAWWQQHRSGQAMPDAPDPESLAEAHIWALDIAKDVDYAKAQSQAKSSRTYWESALRRIDAILEVKRSLGRPADDIAMDRGNRANVLGKLGRFVEAISELEACLKDFEKRPDWNVKLRGSLAQLLYEEGDVPQAIVQQRRALALSEQLPDSADRALSHLKLAYYLDSDGSSSNRAEASCHQLAALIYRFVVGMGQHLHDSLNDYEFCFRRARDADIDLHVPRVADLLADPAFDSLKQWLRQRRVDAVELQDNLDRRLRRVRHKAWR